ncbi:uncharacterized protein A1O9_01164 [Exophiala aquamarina CBS 119918]|uniref:Nuclear matrix protein n=1 Tax=Exophiala aquamarina CBS 119918 TaxID=1182545 RepID=A0A072PTV9_9EURO|nr:uncharacterized protein A1O9_01164 [Exophiala aquamarina CBS 119918]KEF63187.1 hypothetical protein A1O9_01164 [Exophiala aquamarina CBS 119918]
MSLSDVHLFTVYKPLIESAVIQLSDTHDDILNDTPILEIDCAELLKQVRALRTQNDLSSGSHPHNAAIEAACREIFLDTTATVDITEPAFSMVWVLFDIITVLSDNDMCEPGLAAWLVEDLLDTQTIEGCRKVFDYLESRRERLIAKHFRPNKNLVLLRCCNDLLRRLSRAEDTVFCGRVFIFLFQSFPLGDKSSVNLRGEFHVENATTFDPALKKSEDAIKPMELDPTDAQSHTPQATSEAQTPASHSHLQDSDQKSSTARGTPVPRPSKISESKDPAPLPPPDLDALYPKFWTLQSFFSSPTRLFEATNMSTFKDGIEQTLSCFKSVSQSSTSTTNSSDIKRGLKRKRTSESDVTSSTVSASTFNPKYLTNRDLFDLEVHDVDFRRHILVQALIMLDFLLSLTASSKAKFEGLSNKSVLYAYTLSDEDTKWANATRAAIASYLQQGNGNEGKFYYRMVDTVLSRDKNWVRWKAENCPSISHDSIAPEDYVRSRDTLTRIANSQKAPLPAPPGAGDLAFLSRVEPLEALKHPSKRRKMPTLEDYYNGIQTDDLDLDFATEEEKKEIEERKAGKLWRALRTSGRRFVLCENIQSGANLKALIESGGEDGEKIDETNTQEQTQNDENADPDVDAGANVDGEAKEDGGQVECEGEDTNEATGEAPNSTEPKEEEMGSSGEGSGLQGTVPADAEMKDVEDEEPEDPDVTRSQGAESRESGEEAE